MRVPMAHHTQPQQQHRPTTEPQQRTEIHNADDINPLSDIINDLSLTDGKHGFFEDSKAANFKCSPVYDYSVIARTDSIYSSFQTPLPMIHNDGPLFGEPWQKPSSDNRKLPGRYSLNQQRGALPGPATQLPVLLLLAGAPFLPASPDFASTKDCSTAKIRFPNPMFSPIAGNGTEFRLHPQLVESPEEMPRGLLTTTRLLQSPPPPPLLIPLSPELMVRPQRALKMRKTVGPVPEVAVFS
jgi:hypothetical protein